MTKVNIIIKSAIQQLKLEEVAIQNKIYQLERAMGTEHTATAAADTRGGGQGWTPERRAAQSRRIKKLNRDRRKIQEALAK